MPGSLVGLNFSFLSVIKELPKLNGKTVYSCRCICGKKLKVLRSNLLAGHQKSCGVCFKNHAKKISSLVGENFHWLTVIDELAPKNNSRVWLCRCKCGNETTATRYVLTSGHKRSCGCLQSSVTAQRNTTHGKSRSPEHTTWCGIIDRCCNPKNKSYVNYGGRGIRVCNRWRHSFENFLADIGRKPSPQHSIERKNNNGNYEPSNCVWVTKDIQSRNNRRNVKVTYNGKTKTVSDWAREIGVSFSCLRIRLAKPNWTLEKSMTTPSRYRDKKITYRGQSETADEWSKTLGIPVEAIERRIYKKHWRTHRAFKTKNINL